jgi:AraC-like DNA-binding protein
MDSELHFGWRTALLGLAALQILVLAVALALQLTQRTANWLLAGALLVVVGLLTPYAIGFAGAYDLWPGLTFAPLALPLAIGPLLFSYTYALGEDRPPPRFTWHLAPAALQAAYFGFCFLLPMRVKWAWFTGGHRQWAGPVMEALTLISLAAYGWAIHRVLASYRARLKAERSDDDLYAARWLSHVLAAFFCGFIAQLGFWLWSVVEGGTTYFQELGLYLGLAAIGLYLGAAGWRHSRLPPAVVARPALQSGASAGASSPDWAGVAAELVERILHLGLWRDAQLTLAHAARALGTNSGRLSRALNLGLGVNFSEFINGLRAEGVAEALRLNPKADLLRLALDMGFSSKASFNRSFKARFGMTPSDYRRRVSDPAFIQRDEDVRRSGSCAVG